MTDVFKASSRRELRQFDSRHAYLGRVGSCDETVVVVRDVSKSSTVGNLHVKTIPKTVLFRQSRPTG
jgi:hypothetical protein